MVLDRHEEEGDTIEELDPVDGADTHVEEDTKEHGEGNVLEHGRKKHGQPNHDGDCESCQTLV